jgi:hypothetical protein
LNSDLLKAFLPLTTGTAGTIIAAVNPWQEHIEWGLRILLLILSIASVLVGLIIAARAKKTN